MVGDEPFADLPTQVQVLPLRLPAALISVPCIPITLSDHSLSGANHKFTRHNFKWKINII